MTNINTAEGRQSLVKIDFFNNRRKFFALSGVLLLIGLICNIIFGARLDIQFVGGAMIRYSVSGGEVNAEEVRSIVYDELARDSTVAVSQAIGTGEQQVTISFAGNEGLTVEEQTQVADVLTAKYDQLSFSVVESSSVDPTMGSKFFLKCIICLLITVAILLIYIAFRFKKIGGLSAGVMAVVALLHDVLITYFVFIIFRMPINDIFIAVILTILGYSLNDTIVIYDRVRENRRVMGPKTDISVLVNVSLNQTMVRSLLTSLTTFSALLVVYIVASVYGLTTVQTFALPMMAGVISGCYSSLFVAAPLYAEWQIQKGNKLAASKGAKKK